MRRSLADGFVENPGSFDQADGELRDEVEEFGGGGLHDGLGWGVWLGGGFADCMADNF
jgi:hypothetical protein